MLYDNGQLLFLYCDGWQLSKDARYLQIVEETIAWLQRDMRDKSGAFYSSFDADSLDPHGHSEVGTFYVWQPIDVKTLLTPNNLQWQANVMDSIEPLILKTLLIILIWLCNHYLMMLSI